MPTTRPRHLVTETDDLAKALDAAAVRWPGVSRPQLLVRLALEGHAQARQARDGRAGRRTASLREHAGSFTGVYGADHLARMREDWPE
jgi:hypothetical protein